MLKLSALKIKRYEADDEPEREPSKPKVRKAVVTRGGQRVEISLPARMETR